MSGGAEGIANYQKCIVTLLIFRHTFEQFVNLYLAEISIGFDEFDSQKLFQFLVGSVHNRSIVLEVDLFACLDCFQSLDGDVLGVSEA